MHEILFCVVLLCLLCQLRLSVHPFFTFCLRHFAEIMRLASSRRYDFRTREQLKPAGERAGKTRLSPSVSTCNIFPSRAAYYSLPELSLIPHIVTSTLLNLV